MWRLLCLLLFALPAWAQPFATSQIPDSRATHCDYEDTTTGETARVPVVVHPVHGRVCRFSVAHWAFGSAHNARMRAVDTATGEVSAWFAATLDKPASATVTLALVPGVTAPPPPPNPTMTTITETFTGAGALPGQWDVEQGAADVASDEMRINTTGFVDVIVRHTTALSGADQYVKIVAGTPDFYYPIIFFRFTDNSSPFYLIYIDGTTANIDWTRKASTAASSDSNIASGNVGGGAVNTGDSFGLTCIGTGTSTTVRVWRNPVGDAPASDGLTWNGASPGLTLTTDPPSPVNSGLYVGTGGTQNTANQIQISRFTAGDVGGGGSASILMQMMAHHH